jgi:hypothetical protein
MKGIASSLITGVLIVAVVFVLVRPGSKGPTLVTSVSTGLKNLVSSATGGGSWAKG